MYGEVLNITSEPCLDAVQIGFDSCYPNSDIRPKGSQALVLSIQQSH